MALDGLTYKEMYESLDAFLNKKKVFKAGEGAGASGSFFFFSRDNRFLVKTMTEEERDVILRRLDDFLHHFEKCDKAKRPSLLARIYGIYTIKTDNFRSVHIQVMQNAAKFRNKRNKIYQFDLKGSKHSRFVPFDVEKATIFGALERPRRMMSMFNVEDGLSPMGSFLLKDTDQNLASM